MLNLYLALMRLHVFSSITCICILGSYHVDVYQSD